MTFEYEQTIPNISRALPGLETSINSSYKVITTSVALLHLLRFNMAKPYKVISMTPTEAKPILNKICSFLHQVYVNEQKWHFGEENPSKIRIETDSETGKLLLIDKFMESSHWFIGFNEEMTEVLFARHYNSLLIRNPSRILTIQLNKYETAPYFFLLNQNLTCDCLLISVFLPKFD